MTRPIIQTEKMCFTYPDGTSALNNINIEILEGERAVIIGSNGAGKSTLFSHFNGILRPTSGIIKIDGEPASYKKDDLLKIRQKGVWCFRTLMISFFHSLLRRMWLSVP